MSQISVFFLLLVLISFGSIQGERTQRFFPQANGKDYRNFPPPADTPDMSPPGKDEWGHFQHRGHRLQSTQYRHSSKLAVSASTSPATTEIFYNLEVVPCPYACLPSAGQTRTYDTWIYYSKQGYFRCWSKEVSSSNIQTSPGLLGDIYTIRSEKYGEPPYYPRRLQYFNIKCPVDGMIKNMTTDLEGKLTLDISHEEYNYCVDYVDVMYKETMTSCQVCGNQTLESKGCQVDFDGEILVTFRTSRLNNFKGFEMNVICYDASEQDLPGCIQTLPAKEEKSTTSQEDRHYYYSTPQNFLPANAEEQLMNFYTNNVNAAHTFSAESNYDMLQLAVLSENSCNAVLRAIGRGVSQTFPANMVKQARINVLGWEYV